MWIPTNPNPEKLRTDDCTVRALSIALDIPWDSAYVLLVSKGLELKVMPDKPSVIHSVLREHGFRRHLVPDSCPDCYTIEHFCRDHPVGKYVVASDNHIVAIINANIFDTWNSSSEIVQYYWEA